MSYSKNLRMVAIGRRVISLIIGAAVLGLTTGGVLGYTLKAHITAKQGGENKVVTNIPFTTEFTLYGVYDERKTMQEVSLFEWVSDLEFTQLDVPLDVNIQEFTYYLCAAYNLDFSLVMALIQHESNYQADIVSSSDDYGLMQINSCNHEELTETLGVTDYLDPYENIRAGCFTIRKLFEKYKDTNMVLMAYNMGEKGASRLWGKGIYNTKYTDSILNIQQQLNEELEGGVDEGTMGNH